MIGIVLYNKEQIVTMQIFNTPQNDFATREGETTMETDKTKNMLAVPEDSDSVRINITLPKASYDELKKVAKKHGLDMSTFCRAALKTFRTQLDDTEQGMSIYAGRNFKPEKQYILPI